MPASLASTALFENSQPLHRRGFGTPLKGHRGTGEENRA